MVERYHQRVAEARQELAGHLKGKLHELIAAGPYDGQFYLGTTENGYYWYKNDGVYDVGSEYEDPEEPWTRHKKIDDPDKIPFDELRVNEEGEDELINAVWAVEVALRKQAVAK